VRAHLFLIVKQNLGHVHAHNGPALLANMGPRSVDIHAIIVFSVAAVYRNDLLKQHCHEDLHTIAEAQHKISTPSLHHQISERATILTRGTAENCPACAAWGFSAGAQVGPF